MAHSAYVYKKFNFRRRYEIKFSNSIRFKNQTKNSIVWTNYD